MSYLRIYETKVMQKRKRPEVEPVDLSNDQECIDLGLRNPLVQKRTESLWRKTDKERKQLKKLKRSVPTSPYGWAPPTKESDYSDTLIIQVQNFPKTTYVFKQCPNTCVINRIDSFGIRNIVKVYYGGRSIKL
jgi:hypothetical protein